jgi:plastocyanin
MSKWIIIILSVALVGIIGAAGWWWFDMQRTVVVVIRDDAPRALPETVELVRGVRDTLIIRNESSITALVAGRNIAPNQQIRQRFLSAGEYSFECTTHGAATMSVVVRDP